MTNFHYPMRKIVLIILFALFPLLKPSVAAASFVIVDGSASINASTNTVDFTLTFNSSLDLTKIDSFGRLATQFQYYFFSEYPPPFFTPSAQAIITEEPAFLINNELAIRLPDPQNPDPAYPGGYWGYPLLTEFTLNGNTISFSVPGSLVLRYDNQLYYEVFSYEYGGTTSGFHLPAAPEPATWAMILIGFLTMGFLKTSRLSRS